MKLTGGCDNDFTARGQAALIVDHELSTASGARPQVATGGAVISTQATLRYMYFQVAFMMRKSGMQANDLAARGQPEATVALSRGHNATGTTDGSWAEDLAALLQPAATEKHELVGAEVGRAPARGEAIRTVQAEEREGDEVARRPERQSTADDDDDDNDGAVKLFSTGKLSDLPSATMLAEGDREQLEKAAAEEEEDEDEEEEEEEEEEDEEEE